MCGVGRQYANYDRVGVTSTFYANQDKTSSSTRENSVGSGRVSSAVRSDTLELRRLSQEFWKCEVVDSWVRMKVDTGGEEKR